MKKRKKINWSKFWKNASYIFAGICVFAITIIGSIDKEKKDTTISLSPSNNDSFLVSTDQLTESYIVADISSALGLANAEQATYNLAILTSFYESGFTSTDSIDKIVIIDTSNISRGVTTYTVQNGESMSDIAARFGLNTDQIRWSNGLKNTNVAAGSMLYLTKNVSGIVYTVKSGDSLDSIAKKCGSTAEKIIALNGLESSGIYEGMKIAIENGILPDYERPEYVRPTYNASAGKRTSVNRIDTYNYSRSVAESPNNTYAKGNCTWWAWYQYSIYHGRELPQNLGNANNWAARAARAGFVVDHNPTPGSVFQTSSGTYGHVGFVVEVLPSGIWVTEMNYNYLYAVYKNFIPSEVVSKLNFIH